MDELLEFKEMPIYRTNIGRTMVIVYLNQLQQSPPSQSQQVKKKENATKTLEFLDKAIDMVNSETVNQNMLYQLVQYSVQCIFDPRIAQFKYDPTRLLKNSCLIYIQKLKAYFLKQNIDRYSLQKLINKIRIHSIFAQTDEDNQVEEIEGIFNEKEDVHKNIVNAGKKSQNILYFAQEDEEVQQLKIQLFQRDRYIRELKNKLEVRDSALSDVTSGYLKDVQHMKELLFRQSQLKMEELELYEVKYFDQTEGFNEQTTEILNLKLKDLQRQYEKRTSEYMLKIVNQDDEIQRLKDKLQNLQNKFKSLDNPVALFNRAFIMEKDPYQIWKIFQDLKGNDYFFKVFENQKPSYGLNYREINKLLILSKANERDYQQFKDTLQEQVTVFYDKIVNYNESLRNRITELQTELENQKSHQNTISEQIHSLMKNQIKEIIQEREFLLKKKIIQDHEQLYKDKEKFDLFRAQELFSRWVLISRMLKLLNHNPRLQKEIKHQLMNIILNKQKIENTKLLLDKDIQYYKQGYEQILEKNEKDKLNYILMQYNLTKAQEDLQEQQSVVDSYKNKIETMKIEKMHQKSRIAMLENNIQALIKVIEPKISHIKVEEINLEDNKKELNQDLIKKIRFLNQRQSKMLFEIQNQQDFCALLYKSFTKQTSQRNTAVQTNIFDIQKPLLTGFEDYHLVEKFLQKKMGVYKTKEQVTETEISMEQIDQINQNSEKLKSQIENLEQISSQQNQSYLQSIENDEENQSEELMKGQDFKFQQECSSGGQEKEIINQKEKQDNYKFEFDSENFRKTSNLLINKKKQNDNLSLEGRSGQKKKDENQIKSYQTTEYLLRKRFIDKTIFERLYQDSKDKRQRLEVLKNHIETIDQFRWEQILSILSLCSNSNDQFIYYDGDKKRSQTSQQVERKIQSGKSNRAQHFYKSRKGSIDLDQDQQDPETVFNSIQENYDSKKTTYVENMLQKFKNKTKRLQNSADRKAGNACFMSRTGMRSRQSARGGKSFNFEKTFQTYFEQNKYSDEETIKNENQKMKYTMINEKTQQQ